jgi:hypothetical protein
LLCGQCAEKFGERFLPLADNQIIDVCMLIKRFSPSRCTVPAEKNQAIGEAFLNLLCQRLAKLKVPNVGGKSHHIWIFQGAHDGVNVAFSVNKRHQEIPVFINSFSQATAAMDPTAYGR